METTKNRVKQPREWIQPEGKKVEELPFISFWLRMKKKTGGQTETKDSGNSEANVTKRP
jgi:hypothetical protein